MPVPIPPWDAMGVMPPIDAVTPTNGNRSPYEVTLADFVTRFATSPARVQIIDGFLNHRAALHAEGITAGFQWVNGSFVENIEQSAKRPPSDIDVVIFTPSAATADASSPAFDRTQSKQTYSVDPFYVVFDEVTSEELVNWSAYWYSVWSHRRSMVWKGYLQIDMSSADDARARLLLTQIQAPGILP